MIVTAHEEPVLATDGDASELALGAVVVDLEPTVVEEAHEGGFVPARVVERGAEQPALIGDLGELDLDPREERLDVRSRLAIPELLALRRRHFPETLLVLEDAMDPVEGPPERPRPW
jgi:hypothetical protein